MAREKRAADFVAEHLLRHFNIDFDIVESVVPCQNDLIMRQVLFLVEDCGFDLRRKDIDAADDEHVVAAVRYF